ncbi:hypothetical protein ATANTOWER_024058 [Ataeniobius toweri]|uniref:Uncharacterized protein n=1 Tax=Ataeniobius toweri TaxID=208326 RepID=A0ABU7C404_9TELE|nr:hypothetical protein [Ataeniobius toweri]
MTSHAVSTTVECGTFTVAKITLVNSLGKKYGQKLTANSSISGLQRRHFTVTCPGLHDLLYTSTASPPPLHLSLHFKYLSARMVKKPGRERRWSQGYDPAAMS